MNLVIVIGLSFLLWASVVIGVVVGFLFYCTLVEPIRRDDKRELRAVFIFLIVLTVGILLDLAWIGFLVYSIAQFVK